VIGADQDPFLNNDKKNLSNKIFVNNHKDS